MRTTLKRGIGWDSNGDVEGTLPPVPRTAVAVYRQPPPPSRSRRRLALSVFGWLVVVLATAVTGVAGGAYLYLHETVAAVAPKSVEVKRALKKLQVALPGQPATALLVGYDWRAGDGKGAPSRSDTLMLVRADPDRKTISLLSFPRDLKVEVRCPRKSSYVGRINSAYTYCGPEGTLQTVKNLTGLPVNYLITVNFRGFRQIVDSLGGIWLDIDRRYYNDRGGPGGYATINLQPGYQRLGGYQALDFVRFRHTDSDIHRNARQQLFVRALKNQIEANFSVTKLPKVIRAITDNVEVGQGGGNDVGAKTVLAYAMLAYSLPPGRVFQSRIDGLEGYAELTTAPENVTRAVQQFANPDIESPRKATAVALGEKTKLKAPPPRETTVTVLNGNGITGSASNAGYLLGQRGYEILTPPNGVPANAPGPPAGKGFGYFRTQVFFDQRKQGAQLAAKRVASLFGNADVVKASPVISTLSNGAMIVTVVGQTFHGRLASAPVDQTPKRAPANVQSAASASVELLRERQPKVPFPLMVPTVIDRERPVRLYRIDEKGKHKTVRLTFRTGGREYWGIQQTDWADAPALKGRNFVRRIGGRRYELYYNGPKLHMVVLRTRKGTYWVVNTLLDSLSNETMLAIAKGLRTIPSVKS